jgi:hypothetical protein
MFCPLAPVEFKFCLIYFFFFLDLEQGIKVMQGLLKKINLGVVGLPCLTKPTRPTSSIIFSLVSCCLSYRIFAKCQILKISFVIMPIMFHANKTVVENIPGDIIKGDLHKPPPVGVLALAVVPDQRLKSII